jgi:hypothetical protein
MEAEIKLASALSVQVNLDCRSLPCDLQQVLLEKDAVLQVCDGLRAASWPIDGERAAWWVQDDLHAVAWCGEKAAWGSIDAFKHHQRG